MIETMEKLIESMDKSMKTMEKSMKPWKHKLKLKAKPFLEPNQNRKTVPSDVAGPTDCTPPLTEDLVHLGVKLDHAWMQKSHS